MGYVFGDEHLNNIIYQALTIPTFRLVIFASPNAGREIGKLRELDDSRIWIIDGSIPKDTQKDMPMNGGEVHFFDTIVENFMPQRPNVEVDEAISKVYKSLFQTNNRQHGDTE